MQGSLIEAVLAGNREAAAQALAHGADVNGTDTNGLTALMLASGRGHAAIVQLLLEKGANVGQLDPIAGNQALHHAAQHGNAAVVKLLLGAGAFINLQNPFNGHTPLIDAIIYKNPRPCMPCSRPAPT